MVKNQCLTLGQGISESGDINLKSKVQYLTQDEAIIAAKKINSKDSQIHKVVPYKCDICKKYHIGKNKTILTDKDKLKNKFYRMNQ